MGNKIALGCDLIILLASGVKLVRHKNNHDYNNIAFGVDGAHSWVVFRFLHLTLVQYILILNCLGINATASCIYGSTTLMNWLNWLNLCTPILPASTVMLGTCLLDLYILE